MFVGFLILFFYRLHSSWLNLELKAIVSAKESLCYFIYGGETRSDQREVSDL